MERVGPPPTTHGVEGIPAQPLGGGGVLEATAPKPQGRVKDKDHSPSCQHKHWAGVLSPSLRMNSPPFSSIRLSFLQLLVCTPFQIFLSNAQIGKSGGIGKLFC